MITTGRPRGLVDWLLHEEQSELFEILVAVALNLLFLLLSALVLWPLRRLGLAAGLAKGYGVLWIVLFATAPLMAGLQQRLRVNIYDHGTVYIVWNLLASCFLQVGWSAFAALAVRGSVAGLPVWATVIVYVVGVLSCLAAFFAVSSFFYGAIYKLVSLPVALAAFAVFGVWPVAAQVAYGWFFRWIERLW